MSQLIATTSSLRSLAIDAGDRLDAIDVRVETIAARVFGVKSQPPSGQNAVSTAPIPVLPVKASLDRVHGVLTSIEATLGEIEGVL